MLLATKLARPGIPAIAVPRQAIFSRLGAWRQARAIFVHAPAGYGKSSLLRLWLETAAAPREVAWLSLDKSERAPREFMACFVAALKPLAPELYQSMQPVLEDVRSSPLHAAERLLETLENSVRRAAIGPPLLMVLDDFHRCSSAAVDELLGLLLEHGREYLRLAILSRQATVAPLAKYYIAGEVLTITAEDLRFDAAELHQYFTVANLRAVSEAEMARLLDDTEGWIAALQLAAITLRQRGDFGGWRDNLHGDSRWLVEYLTIEVLNQQPAAIQRFLLETSILDRFNPALCAAVTGVNNAHQLLAAIADADLFLIPLDTRQEWFRYHHLFQELLQLRLRVAQDSRSIAQLHRLAARWLADAGDIDTAVSHFLAAAEPAAAAAVVAAHVRPALLHGEIHRAQRWLDLLPAALLDTHPSLLLDVTLLNIMRDSPEALESVLRAERALKCASLDAVETAIRQAEIYVLRTTAHLIRQEYALANAFAAQALHQQAVLDDLQLGILKFSLFHLRQVAGLDDSIFQLAQEAIDAFQRTGFGLGVLSVQRELGTTAMASGQSEQALRQFEAIFALVDQPYMMRDLASAYMQAAMLCYWMDRVEQSLKYLQVVRVAADQLADASLNATVQCMTQLCALARGADNAGSASLPEVIRYGPLEMHICCYQVRLLVRMGHSGEALALAQHLRVGLDSAPDSHPPLYVASFLYAYIAHGVNLNDCALLLEGKLAAVTRHGIHFYRLAFGTLSAWRHLKLRQHAAARAELAPLLDLACQTGCRRHILDIPELAPLLAEMDHPLAATFFAQMQQEYGRGALAALTPQERAVLRLLGQDRKYWEIADELTISINTVRTHVCHIYRKLNVDRRLQAVAVAKAAELV